MLTITADKKRFGSWHVGEEMNIPQGPVITFQADGHELTAILQALRAAGVTINYPSDYLTPVF